MWCALHGIIMPITNGVNAYEIQAFFNVFSKHAATIIYLLISFLTLKRLLPNE